MLGYDIFLNWNAAFFKECLDNYWAGDGDDPRPGWYNGQIGFIEGYILPLAERCSTLVPHCQLAEGARKIVQKWKKGGEAFTQHLIKQSAMEKQFGISGSGISTAKENSTKTSGETSSKLDISSLKKKAKSLKILKRLLSHRDSHSISSSARDIPKELPSIDDASLGSVSIQSNSMNKLQDDGVLAEEDHVGKNQGPKDSANKPTQVTFSVNKPQLNGISEDDHGYKSFLRCLDGTAGKASKEVLPEVTPEVPNAVEHDDSFESFLEILGT